MSEIPSPEAREPGFEEKKKKEKERKKERGKMLYWYILTNSGKMERKKST